MVEKHLHFYKNIPKSSLSLSNLLKDKASFFNVPKTWSIVVTDIENSTSAVARGVHKDVNLGATGSIVTVMNTLKEIDKKIKIPYFFGGDGATFIVPNFVLTPVLEALNEFSQHILQTLNLNLRVGHVEVDKVYTEEVTLKIAKVGHNKYFTTPVVLGNGLKYAESIIKNRFMASAMNAHHPIEPNLEGMECRWDEIYPSQTDKKVICLLIDCENEGEQAEVYGTIMKEIDLIFGDLEKRNPISTLKLKLNTSLANLRKEMNVKFGRHKTVYLVSNWFITLFGIFYFKFFRAGRLYKYRITQLSDTIMLDGFLNTVISGTDKQVVRLKTLLDNLERQHKIIYGIHITHASIMSCYIEDRDEKHIHFVDGTEGGYTSAAIMFKQKLANLKLRRF